jgi:hypothetical protein
MRVLRRRPNALPGEVPGMISAALAFIHARKWLVELILLAVLVAGVVLFCQHLVDVGVQRERAAWQTAATKARQAAELKLAHETERANIAEKARAIELAELDNYVRDHPLHGSLDSLCRRAGNGGMPATTSPDARHAGAGAAGGDVQSLPSGNNRGDEDEPDQLGMLSALEVVADGVSAGLREYQARAQ